MDDLVHMLNDYALKCIHNKSILTAKEIYEVLLIYIHCVDDHPK